MESEAMQQRVDISVIIPAFNERERLAAFLDSVIGYFCGLGAVFEILIVDDGSTDSTAELVQNYVHTSSNIHLLRLQVNHGKGYAVRAGMLQAHGKERLFADADGATPISEYWRLKHAIENGAEVAVASRVLPDSSRSVESGWHRLVLGRIFNCLVRMLVVRGIYDTQCGFKLFRADAAERLFKLQRLDGFCFDVELLALAQRLGVKVKEVPVNWVKKPGGKLRLFLDSLLMLTDLLKIRRNLLLDKYETGVRK